MSLVMVLGVVWLFCEGEKVPQVVVQWKGNQFKDCCSHNENLKWKPMHIEGEKKTNKKTQTSPKPLNSILC